MIVFPDWFFQIDFQIIEISEDFLSIFNFDVSQATYFKSCSFATLKFIKVNNGFIIGIGIVSYVNVYLPVIV